MNVEKGFGRIAFEHHPLLDAEALAGEYRSPVDGGRAWFAIADGALEKLEERCVQDAMAPAAACCRLGDLVEALRGNPQISWAWIDVYMGTLVSLVRCSRLKNKTGALSASVLSCDR